MTLQWGIVGISKISHDFCIALRSKLTVSEHEVVAVASVKKEMAHQFSTLHDIPNTYGSYEELARDSAVEVVYVAVPKNMQLAVSRLMLEHGKHVLCEKPFGMNSTQAQELITLAEKHLLFVMEGLWSRFFPVYRHLSRLIDFQLLGDIKEVYVKHGERIDAANNNGDGIVMSLGSHAIQFVLFVFREAPKTIKAKGKINTNCVDLWITAELTFSKGRKAFIVCSGLEELDNQATIITTKGPICIPKYWCPTTYLALGKIYQWNLVETPQPHAMNFTNSVGMKYEADAVSKCIRAGKLQSSIAPPKDTLLIAKIQDEIRKQIGVRYKCDKGL